MKHYIGFDLGGTKVVAAVLDENFNILSRSKEKAGADKGPESVYEIICYVIHKACEEADIELKSVAAIGGCAPGLVCPKRAWFSILQTCGLKNFPLRQKLENDFKLPVIIENDVNAGLYGELKFGAAKGFENVIAISPGTGVGGGIIINGKPYRGTTGGAGEFGHIVVQPDGPLCGCGQRGCLEHSPVGQPYLCNLHPSLSVVVCQLLPKQQMAILKKSKVGSLRKPIIQVMKM